MTRQPCAPRQGQPIPTHNPWWSTTYPDHLAAKAICETCPLMANCRPGPEDQFAEGTYGGQLWIDGKPKPINWDGTNKNGDRRQGKAPVTIQRPCSVCGTLFPLKRSDAMTCSPRCSIRRSRARAGDVTRADGLTSAQKQLRAADMHRRGHTNSSIAKELGTTLRTVERYLANVRRDARQLADQTMTADDRRRMHNAFTRGERTPEVLAGERAYQRNRKRKDRAA